MRCWRLDLWRKYIYYVDGQLSVAETLRVEAHLLECSPCRARVARLRRGHHLAAQLPTINAQSDSWAQIEAGLDGNTPVAPAYTYRPPRIARWQQRRAWLVFASVAVMVVTASFLLFQPSKHSTQLPEFHAVKIAEIEKNTEPHIVAEGYVSELRLERDGDLTFRLVEDLQRTQPFIVCEIVKPINIKPPAVGARVRVYGVSRYDAKEHHRWYEVHPVLNIEPAGR